MQEDRRSSTGDESPNEMESGNERPIDWDLLTRHVSGACSTEEDVIVETWAAADPRHRRMLEDLQQAWHAVGPEEDALPVDVDAAWGRLSQRIEETAGDPKGPLPPRRAGGCPPARRASPHASPVRISRRSMMIGGAGAAAVLAIGVALALLWGGEGPGDSFASREKVFTTKRGQRAVVELTDGTQVRLNADSRLVIPRRSLAEGRREVHLDGEAFFKVARDSTRPFRVRTGAGTVCVLGTAFNVQAYAADAAPMQVAVSEGAVALQAGEAGTGDTLRLLPRQLGIARRDGGLQARRDVDLSAQLAWTNGQLAFDDAPFSEVVRKLERWYDLQVEVRLPTRRIDHLNARFDDESLQEILGDIAVALNLRYERTRETVVFYRPNAPVQPKLTQ